jgi:glyoxylase-like metal-dependent hydrolase (beta-lactamase superfamily II)
MAERMRIETGAPVQVHSAERDALDRAGAGGWPPSALAQEFDRWKVPGDRRAELEQMAAGAPARPTIHIDRVIEDGERLDIPGFELVAMLTPGHTVGSLSLRDEANGLMFTGDVLLPTLHAGLGLGGLTDANPLRDYLESLRALRKYPDYQILPGHGYRFTGLVDRSEQSAEHHLKRAREVAAVLSSDPGTSTWDVARRLSWTAGWEQLAGFYLYSALSQTDMHRDFVVQGGLAGEPIVRTP